MASALSAEHRAKAVRLVDYLLRLAFLRTRLIRDVAEYEKVLWISSIPRERDCFTQAWGRDEEHEPDEWLEVQNRREPELPSVPVQCSDWVDGSSLRIKNDLPSLLPRIPRKDKSGSPDQRNKPDGAEAPTHGQMFPVSTFLPVRSNPQEIIPSTERLDEHPEIQRAWDRYVEDKWLPWTEEHNAWERVHKAYSALFAIHQEQLRLGEEYELVLALGFLTWLTPTGQRVRRHLVVADAVLDFEARLGRFIVRPHAEGAKLRPELDMLDIEEQPAHAEESAKASLTGSGDDPWDKGTVAGVLQALVHSISPQGEYDESLDARGIRASAKPVVEYAPALILRKRSAKGLTETLRRIRERIESGEVIPDGFADVAEIRSQDGNTPEDILGEMNTAFDGEVFFPKPSNEEQRRIVDKIRASNGVLVQGPPGTGKSHTIANLICHLLATGQRVLVTAKTPRALQVLERLVPDELQPLCIRLLGSGPEERKSLESSVGGILRKNEEWNAGRSERDRADLETRLRALREEKATLTRRLREIRESETHSQSIAEGTYRGTAARIAEAVNRDRDANEWFTDVVPLDSPCSVSEGELASVLADLRCFTPERRRSLSLTLPDALPSSERYARLVENEARATQEEVAAARGSNEETQDLLSKSSTATVEAIREALFAFHSTHRSLLASPHTWVRDALRDIVGGSSSLWHELSRSTSEAISSAAELLQMADDTTLAFPEATSLKALFDDASRLKEHRENGGRLGWGPFRPKLVKERIYVVKTVRVNGRLCSTASDFSLLANAAHLRHECERAWGLWAGRSDRAIGPLSLQIHAIRALKDTLDNTLAIEGLIKRCRQVIRECPGIGEPVWSDGTTVELLIASCYLATARHRKRLAVEEIRSIEAPVSSLAMRSGVHPITGELLRAIRERDSDGYAQAVNEVRETEKDRLHLQKMEENMSRLYRLLPTLAEELTQTCDAPYWNGRLQRIRDSWHWAQARNWIEDYIRQEDVPAISKRARQIDDEMSAVIAILASLHAWSFCFSRLKEGHRRHMEAWQQSMRRLGKGTGKHAPHHRREAQQHLNECREAVPAWVMPLHRIWDTVDPMPGMFDVIIVDEASQCGPESLPLFYLGKKILIVGDDKQISPDAVGLPRDSVHRLMEELLYDYRFKSSFDVESSLFDHGKLRYGTRRITLREHFRCMPEIIRFSNDLCYSDTPLIPLRRFGTDRLAPLEHVLVSGGHREGSESRTINRPEADAIVKRIAELCGDRRYDGKTLGVVVLQGDAQASLIENQLLERLGAEEMEKRRLVCGNPYSFQGDERDIMLLSLVAASNKRIGPLTKPSDERRFNVAASRARDQMILFHSVTCEDLSASCLRRRLLEFFSGTQPHRIAGLDRDELERSSLRDNRGVVSAPAPFESWFELDVALELARQGFNVLPQYEFAGRRIDLVVQDGPLQLAVECDGDRWHGADRYEEDMQRQRQLERCGWEFFRVREATFYANRVAALEGLWRALEERGIAPSTGHEEKGPDNVEEEGGDAEFDSDDTSVDDPDRNAENATFDDSEDDLGTSGRRAEEVPTSEIQEVILLVLSECPNRSCTLDSLTSRILKAVGVLTRGNPRREFAKRVMRCLSALEQREAIEKYRAKNKRVRLVR